MFLVCVFSDMGYPDVVWGHHVGIDTVNWNRYREVDTAHIHFGVVIFDDSDGDGEMGRWGYLCVVGSGTGLSWGLGYPGDGIISLIGEMGSSGGGEEVGDGDNLRYTCNLLEHE